MFKCEASVRGAEHTERNALATSQDKTEVEPVLFKDENEMLQEKIEENEKYRDILIQMVKGRVAALLPPEANTESAREDAGQVTNTNNANHLSGLPSTSALSDLLANPDQYGLVNLALPPQSSPDPPNPLPAESGLSDYFNRPPISYGQKLSARNEERDHLTAKLRIVECERQRYLYIYKKLQPHNPRERTKQSGDGVQGGKVKKDKGGMKRKHREQQAKDRLDRHVSDAFLERLESSLVIREKAHEQA